MCETKEGKASETNASVFGNDCPKNQNRAVGGDDVWVHQDPRKPQPRSEGIANEISTHELWTARGRDPQTT